MDYVFLINLIVLIYPKTQVFRSNRRWEYIAKHAIRFRYGFVGDIKLAEQYLINSNM